MRELIRNVWIYWLSSNVDTWQAKVILHFRMRKYYEHKHFLLYSAVSSSTAAKQTRPLLVTADCEEALGRYCRENTAQQTLFVWCQSRERQFSDHTGLLPELLTLALFSTVLTTKFRADFSLLYKGELIWGREQTWMSCSDTHVPSTHNGRCSRASSCCSCPSTRGLVERKPSWTFCH